MFTTSDVIKRKLELKGFTVYDIYVASGFNRNVYTSFEINRFTKRFLEFIGKIINEDLSMYANA